MNLKKTYQSLLVYDIGKTSKILIIFNYLCYYNNVPKGYAAVLSIGAFGLVASPRFDLLP